MTTTTTKINTSHDEADRLADAAAKAVAQANEARARADEAAKRAEIDRQAAITELRRRRLAAFDEAALEVEAKSARARFTEAVRAGDPGLVPFIDWQVALTRRYVVAVEAEQCRVAVAPEHPAIVTGSPSELVYANEVQKVLASTVANKVEDLADELQAELDAAGR